MPKYVAKEDVEKGLVDPTRPLAEQPQYSKKIEEEAKGKEKEKNIDQKKKYERPKKERPPRKERPKFNYRKEDVTLETVPPQKPKKILEKPDQKKFQQGLEKLKAERQAIKLERSRLLDEQRALIRDINESKKTGKAVITQFSGAMKEKFNEENQIRKQIRILNEQKNKIQSEIDSLKIKSDAFRRPENSAGLSLESIKNRIQEKQHKLMTANIDKKVEARLNNEIQELKRALPNAKPMIEIQAQIDKIEDLISILYKELNPIKKELHNKIKISNEIKSELDKLKQQRKSEEGNIEEKRTVEDVKTEYDIKIKNVEDKRDKLEDKIDDYYYNNTTAKDEYEDQKDLLDYIDWIEKQKEWLKKRQEEEARKKKEQEERDKKRQKEKEEYEKRKEERRKRQEERKVREEQRAKKIEEERQKFINRNPNHQIISLCHNLIDYCNNLRPSAFKNYEDPRSKTPGELNFGKQWQKQIKGGVQVVVSKKAKQDEEAKKSIKPKKKQEKAEDEDFDHGIQIVNQFQGIKLLPPKNSTEIDSTIKLIQDKITFYNNPTEEQKASFREKSIKQWEELQGLREKRKQGNFKEREEVHQQDQKEHRQKKQHTRKQKKEFKEGDFPEIS